MDLEKLLWARNYHLKNGCLPRMSFWDKKMYLSNIMLLGAGSNFAAAGNTHSIDLERDLSQYLTAADSASLSITGDITIECWAKAESAAPNNDTMTLVSKLATVSNNHSFIFYFWNIVTFSTNKTYVFVFILVKRKVTEFVNKF